MAKYKAYPEYKESGVEWLGEVPLNWHIHSLKRAIDSCTNGVWGGEPDDKHDLIVLRVADFERQSFKISDLKLTTRSILPKDRGSRLLKKGDLLIEKSGGGDKTLVGCVVLFDKEYEAVTSNFVAKMSPRESYDSHFLTYAFSQLYAGKVNYPSIKQTTGIQNLDADAYLMEKFCFPPMHEQRNISCFLDHETAKIDNLIEKQQQLIELLKEKRQAVISHAVTKGLNPDVSMKDSGVEWLGKVPAHWGVMPVKYVCALIKDGTHLPPPRVENGIPLLSVRNIIGGVFQFRDDDSQISHKDYKSLCSSFIPKKDDVLLAIVGATLGKVALVPEMDSFHIQRSLGVFRTNKLIHPQHLSYIFESKDFQNLLWENAGFSAQPGIYLGTLSNFCVPVPPVTEQLKISEFITATVDKLDLLITQASKLIGLIQERRTALISAAVTGKIDVRDWVAPDTQDVEEPQEATT